jgi:hypothetical protein
VKAAGEKPGGRAAGEQAGAAVVERKKDTNQMLELSVRVRVRVLSTRKKIRNDFKIYYI